MSRYSLIFLQLLLWSAYGQVQQSVSFRKDYHDFGSVTEKKGKVSHVFYFKNGSQNPVQIKSVESACGCTIAEWTSEPVQPGKEGQIKAEYDPAGRPGYFNKTISVIFSSDSTPYNLQIRGQVFRETSAGSDADTDGLEHMDGQLKTRSAGFNLGKVYINQDPVYRNFTLYNAGNSDLIIKETETPEHLKVNYPSRIRAGTSEILSIKFIPNKIKVFGLHTDQLVLKTNDANQPEKHFSVYATVEEFFPVMSPEELEEAPSLQLSVSEIKFPSMKQGAVLEREIVCRNTGKKTLKIRSVITNCSCLSAVADAETIEPGSSVKIKIRFSSAGRIGRQIKSVMIYSNDPLHPVQKITLNGLVNSN